jgi:hypothetical protein
MVPMQSGTQPCNSLTPRFGRLRHGGRPMDPLLTRLAPPLYCTPKARQAAVRGFLVCRMHGARGGPKTNSGLERCRKAAWRPGEYSQERKQFRREVRAVIRFLNTDLKQIAREVQMYLRFRRLGLLSELPRSPSPCRFFAERDSALFRGQILIF